jgi:hypothetical protein
MLLPAPAPVAGAEPFPPARPKSEGYVFFMMRSSPKTSRGLTVVLASEKVGL